MKKLIALILALCTVFLVASCDKNETPQPSQNGGETVDGVEVFKNLYAVSAPTKVVTTQKSVIGTVTLNGGSTLVTGALSNGSAATVYTYKYELLQSIEEGAGEIITPIMTTIEGSREYVEGEGERYDGGAWDPEAGNFAPTPGSIAINLDASKLRDCVYSSGNNIKTLSFSVKKKDVAAVLGSDGISSDVNVVITANEAVITGITISYTETLVPEDEDLLYPDVEITISTVYSYGIEEITLVKN